MKVLILLKDIGYEPKDFHTTLSPEDLEYSGEYEILEDIDVNIKVQKTDIGYKIRISGKTTMKFVCSRCLDEFEREYVFEDENILRKGYESLERLSDMDVETLTIERDEIDVLPLIRDIFIATLPINPLCSENCLGICPVCGVKMNGVPHNHKKEGIKLGDIINAAKRR